MTTLRRAGERAWRTSIRGKIYSLLGKDEAAEDAYEQSVRLLTELIDQAGAGPHSQQYRYDLAESYRGLGNLMTAIGRQGQGRKGVPESTGAYSAAGGKVPRGNGLAGASGEYCELSGRTPL